MDFIDNEIMDVMNQRFQYNAGKTGGTSHNDPGEDQELVPAQPVAQPVQYKLITPCFFQSVLLKISFKFKKAQIFLPVMNVHLCRIMGNRIVIISKCKEYYP